MSENAHEIIGKNFQIARLAEIDPTPCPCGQARRAFMNDQNEVASMHLVEIKKDSETHYHKRMTEIYYVLEGSGHIELDDETHELRPGTAVLIQPGCKHRAVGSDLKILNIPVPKFNPEDEHHV
ncbi:MAG: cupin domain-containing protein [Verrucomicrobiales bacterium]|nr:cupin domain-containing protein [Verrucomicrobiales bacterium]